MGGRLGRGSLLERGAQRGLGTMKGGVKREQHALSVSCHVAWKNRLQLQRERRVALWSRVGDVAV